MVTYRAGLDVPSDLDSWLENRIATRRDEAGGPWRALTTWDQAIVLLVYFAKGETYGRLGTHFGIGTGGLFRPASRGSCNPRHS